MVLMALMRIRDAGPINLIFDSLTSPELIVSPMPAAS
jgi:hypothetical protein